MAMQQMLQDVLLAMVPGEPTTSRLLEKLVPSLDGGHPLPDRIKPVLIELERGGFVERDRDRWRLTANGVRTRSDLAGQPDAGAKKRGR